MTVDQLPEVFREALGMMMVLVRMGFAEDQITLAAGPTLDPQWSVALDGTEVGVKEYTRHENALSMELAHDGRTWTGIIGPTDLEPVAASKMWTAALLAYNASGQDERSAIYEGSWALRDCMSVMMSMRQKGISPPDLPVP